MAEHCKTYWIHALTPLHVGSGEGKDFIDLPLMREKVTNWPVVPGSAVKGVLADHHGAASEDQRKNDPLLKAAFGIADDTEDPTRNQLTSNAGSLVFTDARLVCLPVRSFFGTFAWCTSPMALRRLHRDVIAAGDTTWPSTIGEVPGVDQALLPQLPPAQSPKITDPSPNTTRVYLEDLDFTAATAGWVQCWASHLARRVFADPSWQEAFVRRFIVLHDDVFNFLTTVGMDVCARVSLDENKTVKAGPWYEESLPPETILAGMVWCDRVFVTIDELKDKDDAEKRQALLDGFCTGELPLQVGGKATIGKGRVRCVF